jgi:uncharacterized protein (TIGR02996 family)
MHDEAGFLSAIRTTPADDTARLVFADWLDEQDDPICKTKAAFIRLELQLAEAPEQNLNRLSALQQLETLAAQLAPDWLVVVSHPKLEACRVQFQFECPARWDRLKPTDDPKTRFCDTCRKNVHYCDTLQEAQTHAANGHCVALTVVLARRACLARPPEPGKPKHGGPAREISRPVGGHLTGSLAPPRPVPLPQPPLQPPGSVRLTPDQIARLRVVGTLGTPTPAPPPVPTAEPERRERRAGERPHWKQKRKKARRNRNIQRENGEEE